MIIASKRVYINDEFVKANLFIEDKKIKKILAYDNKHCDKDYGDLRILPGFYDIHCHGYNGYDNNEANPELLKMWLKGIVKEGVCGICPTTITQSEEILTAALKTDKEVFDSNYEGARILGVHLEGPYISKEFCGAQPKEYILKADLEQFKRYQKAAGGLIKIITLAPEEDENLELTKYCVNTGVNVSIGHSAASAKQAKEALAAGANCFTHTFNGMSRFSHHEPNLVGTALASDCFAECICDGHHSDLACLKIFFRCKGKNGIMMSDGLMTKGLPIGTKAIFGGQEMQVIEDGTCRLVSTGNFAGSTLKINEGLRILVEDVGVDFNIAVSSCTSAPARYLKIDNHKGYIKEGYDADLAILADDYFVKATYVEGVCFE